MVSSGGLRPDGHPGGGPPSVVNGGGWEGMGGPGGDAGVRSPPPTSREDNAEPCLLSYIVGPGVPRGGGIGGQREGGGEGVHPESAKGPFSLLSTWQLEN